MVDVKDLKPGACGPADLRLAEDGRVGVSDDRPGRCLWWGDRIGVCTDKLPARDPHLAALGRRGGRPRATETTSMNPFPQLAQRIFNTPIAIHPDKAGIILGALAERLGVTQITVVGQGPIAAPRLGR
jgi:hypothetical protein